MFVITNLRDCSGILFKAYYLMTLLGTKIWQIATSIPPRNDPLKRYNGKPDRFFGERHKNYYKKKFQTTPKRTLKSLYGLFGAA